MQVLAEKPEARKDDFILLSYVLDKMGVPSNFDMRTMLHNHEIFKLPCFESVTRARRKVQQLYPELKDKKTAEMRNAEQEKYREFAHEK